MAKKILRNPAVRDRTGLSNSAMYVLIAEGLFPSPISIGKRSVGWLEEEIDDWIEQRIAATRAGRDQQ